MNILQNISKCLPDINYICNNILYMFIISYCNSFNFVMSLKQYSYQLQYHINHSTLSRERDACGVGFLVSTSQQRSHALVVQALKCLTCMEHRGACSADRDTGDGSGITTEIPWHLLQHDLLDITLDLQSPLALGMMFLPKRQRDRLKIMIQWVLEENHFRLIAWRDVPVVPEVLGQQAKQNCPYIEQCIMQYVGDSNTDIEILLYSLRRKIEKVVSRSDVLDRDQFYICSLSSKTVVYKGMLRSAVLGQFYQDLFNPLYQTVFVVYHRRFSTNTMPKWPLAQPMRFIAHNGEINTLLGNLNWMRSRESTFQQTLYPAFIDDVIPVTNISNSDSANLDATVELLVHSGFNVQEALMILIPEAYQNQPFTRSSSNIIDFYKYYEHLQEPWDGPALVIFTDGHLVGATLDRNGLRPARYCITNDGIVIVASEAGIIDLDFHSIREKGRLGPGHMFAVDLRSGNILKNYDLKQQIVNKYPYGEWLGQYYKDILQCDYLVDELSDQGSIIQFHTAFGYSNEDVELVIEHMASSSQEPTFCMGDDIPLAVLSSKNHVLYDYFKQRFAQVTNPAIDPLRESLVMSLEVRLGPRGNLLQPNENNARSLRLNSPILNEVELSYLLESDFVTTSICTFFSTNIDQPTFLEPIKVICNQAVNATKEGSEIIILTDKLDSLLLDQLFIPPLLIVGAVHHHLIAHGLRQNVSLVIETAQCWSTHHLACLIGYGADAVCPYLAFKTVRQWWFQPRTQKLVEKGKLKDLNIVSAQENYKSALEKGLLKILSKMGISLISSYHGAQIFEILGLGADIVDLSFKGTTARISGLDMKELFNEVLVTYNNAFVTLPKKLPNLGYVQYRPGAEYHINNPEMSKVLHKAVRFNDTQLYTKYISLFDSKPVTNLRDVLKITSSLPAISIDEVEPVENILNRFCTGGMSLGALSQETHETLAIAMNRIGGKSNSGEGGEDPKRFLTIKNINQTGTAEDFPYLKGLQENDTPNSSIKQVASGRFGVTPEYLINATQIEIKIAQGAKPGEGGQLPGKKVSPYIATLRNCKPGVTLISPPPHHDIYSIEDLSQLIFDLHQINPDAKVSVKLVSEIGIGTVAAGVVKGNADIIQISGHDGGTGASPLSSIKHAGVPWELGLTEVHQLLISNKLRNRVTLRVDGGLRTGYDIVLATIMGAEEYGFGTIAMIATGCVMARICHTNNCPVGVATQRQDLRNRYPGIPSDLVNFFIFLAEEVRSLLANLGYRKLDDIVGLVDLMQQDSGICLHKTSHLNLQTLLYKPQHNYSLVTSRNNLPHDNGLTLDDELLALDRLISAIHSHGNFMQRVNIVNTNRSVCARISGRIASLHGNYGFQGNIELNFQGTAGQSFAAFLVNGITCQLIGEANDYVGKGMNGGQVIIKPRNGYTYDSSAQVIIGNTCLYGATGGYLFVNGRAGERFAVRNSRASTVVEGVGDHACEYMTGGLVVVLGPAGRNIGAGMTGGLAYFLAEEANFCEQVNTTIVIVQKIPTNAAEEQLKNLISLHYEKTGSSKARNILDNWSDTKDQFWQIVPPSELKTPLTDSSLSDPATLETIA